MRIIERNRKPTSAAPAKYLYVGTTDLAAKLASVKGIRSPVILSDVYPGFFASYNNKGNWGIVEVDYEAIKEDLYPFHGYLEKKNRRNRKGIEVARKRYLQNIIKYKDRWKESLDNSGVCLLMGLHPAYISKVITYDISKRNPVADKLATSVDPWNQTPIQHKKNYRMSQIVTNWLACRKIAIDDFNRTEYCMLDKLNNCEPLEMFYIQSEKERKKTSWWGLNSLN